MMKSYTPKQTILTGILGLGLMLTACTETETIAPPEQRANRILTYTIVNTPNPIYGAVNDLDSTITVYVPYYYYLSLLQAELTVSEGASVTPASGTMIEDVARIALGDTTIHYTITATDGGKADYKLIIDTQQPTLTVNNVTTDPATPAEFPSSYLYLNKYEIYSAIPLTGKNLFKNADGTPRAKVTFIAADGTEIPALAASANDTESLNAIIPFSDKIAPGLYHIRIDCYSQSVTLSNPVRIKSPI